MFVSVCPIICLALRIAIACVPASAALHETFDAPDICEFVRHFGRSRCDAWWQLKCSEKIRQSCFDRQVFDSGSKVCSFLVRFLSASAADQFVDVARVWQEAHIVGGHGGRHGGSHGAVFSFASTVANVAVEKARWRAFVIRILLLVALWAQNGPKTHFAKAEPITFSPTAFVGRWAIVTLAA